MKLLLDQGLPRSAAELLRTRGVDAVHAGEVGLASAGDDEILATGRSEGRVVVTLDADFHALMALAGATKPSVIRLRVEGLTAPQLVDLFFEVFSLCRDDLETGSLVTVRADAIKVHTLPVVRRAEE